MATISRSALVVHTPDKMFDLVNDVAAYPSFLPWCDFSEVHEASETGMLATVSIAKGGVNKRFTTQNNLSTAQRIDMRLVDGPFSSLEGGWEFLPLGADACKVTLNLQFEFESPVLRATFGKVFDQVANSLVDAFVLRANQIYGSHKSGQ